jgi:ferredoxin
MALWFARGLRRGVVTTRYPKSIDEWTADLPTPPMFSPVDLTIELCDHLVAVCPSRALLRIERTLVFDVGACSACGICIALAGKAVRRSGLFELAATRRSDLVKEIPIEGGR